MDEEETVANFEGESFGGLLPGFALPTVVAAI